MKNKKCIILIVMTLIIITIIVGTIYLLKKSPVDEIGKTFIISSESYRLEGDTIYYDANIANNKKGPLEIKKIDIIFKDIDDKKIVVITNEVDKTLEINESISVSAQTKVNTNKKIKSVEYRIY